MTSLRLLVGGALLLAGVAVLAIGFGSVAIAPGDVIGILARQLFGAGEAAQSAGATSIVMELRLPRILAAILVGAALAVAGAPFSRCCAIRLQIRMCLGRAAARHSVRRSRSCYRSVAWRGSWAACSSPHFSAHSHPLHSSGALRESARRGADRERALGRLRRCITSCCGTLAGDARQWCEPACHLLLPARWPGWCNLATPRRRGTSTHCRHHTPRTAGSRARRSLAWR